MLADIRPALRAFLLADSTVSGLVGGSRVYPAVMPQGERGVSLVVNIISEVTNHTMEGASGLTKVRAQLDSYALLSDDADALARAVKERLDGCQGLMGTVQVQGVFADTARSDYQPDVQLYRSSRDYLINFAER